MPTSNMKIKHPTIHNIGKKAVPAKFAVIGQLPAGTTVASITATITLTPQTIPATDPIVGTPRPFINLPDEDPKKPTQDHWFVFFKHNVPAGTYKLTAEAFDKYGKSIETCQVSLFEVKSKGHSASIVARGISIDYPSNGDDISSAEAQNFVAYGSETAASITSVTIGTVADSSLPQDGSFWAAEFPVLQFSGLTETLTVTPSGGSPSIQINFL